MPKPVTPERMQQIFDSAKSWGRWGAQDEAGALNLITPAKRRAAAQLVRTGEVVSLAAMRYNDEYRRAGERWHFAHRTINFLYYVPVTEFKTVFKERNRLAIRGQRMPADYPETLACWQDFHARYVEPGK